jgi:pyrroline-5-carboxylate reductase
VSVLQGLVPLAQVWIAKHVVDAVAAAFGSAGAYAYVVLQALAGQVTLGGLTFYASAVNQVQSARSNIIYQLAALYEMQAERYR